MTDRDAGLTMDEFSLPAARGAQPPAPAQALEAAAQAAASCPRDASGLTFRVARDLAEVVASWKMVYASYRRSGLIPPNPFGLHTAPQAVGAHTAVIVGSIGPVAVSTLTAFADNPGGLPLDRVYGAELRRLRREGCRLMEIGLFADRRSELARSLAALFELMRVAFHYGRSCGVSDFVIGVHPRHARFYNRSFRFEPLGQTKVYPAVNNRPVVLLRGDLDATVREHRAQHPALDYFLRNPFPAEAFESRFRFDEASLEGSILRDYLADREARQRISQTA